MWPWMRDLPTSVWAGHGWAFDENGLRRLSSSGGSHAMQGVEVFESVGLAAEQVKPSDEKIKEEAPIAVAAAENPPPLAEGQKPSRFQRINVAKQSGVPNVQWKNHLQAWEVNFHKIDSQGRMIGKTGRVFSVKKFMGPGISEAQADALALEAARGLPRRAGGEGHPQRAKAVGPQLHQRSAGGEVEEGQAKVACGDHPEERQEEDPRRLLHREGDGRGEGLVAHGEDRPAAPGEARGHAVGAAGVPAEGALPRGDLEPGRAAVASKMQPWWCGAKFQGEAQGPLGGGAGALLPSGSGMEEEAEEGESEGEGERKQGCEVQGEAWEEAAKVSAKAADAQFPSFRQTTLT